MSANGLLDLLHVASDAAPSRSDRSPRASGGDGPAFQSFLNQLLEAGEAQRVERNPAPRVRTDADASSFDRIPPRKREALQRVAKLVSDGSLDADALEDMSGDDWQALEAWVLEGAGGLLPPFEAEVALPLNAGEDGGDETAEDLVALLASLLAIIAGEPPVETAPDGNETVVDDAIAAGTQESADWTTLLGGTDWDADALEALRQALQAALHTEGQTPDAARQQLLAMDADALRQALAQALQAAGEKTAAPPDTASLLSLPEAVVKSLALKVLGVEQAGVNDARALLQQLEQLMPVRAGGLVAAETPGLPAGDGASEAARAAAAPLADTAVRMQDDAEAVADKLTRTGSDAVLPETITDGGDDADGLLADGDEDAQGQDALPRQHLARTAQAVDAALTNETPPEPVEETPSSDRTPLPSFAEIAAAAMETAEASLADEAMPTGEEAAPRLAPVDPGLPTASAPSESETAAPARAAEMIENIERVETVMRMAVRRGLQRVSLRLDPPELGRVMIRVEMRHGVLSATIQAETASARDMLQTGLPQLRQTLQSQGIEVEGMDVDVQSGGDELAEGQGDPRRDGLRRQHARRTPAAVEETPAPDAPVASAWVGPDGRINLIA